MTPHDKFVGVQKQLHLHRPTSPSFAAAVAYDTFLFQSPTTGTANGTTGTANGTTGTANGTTGNATSSEVVAAAAFSADHIAAEAVPATITTAAAAAASENGPPPVTTEKTASRPDGTGDALMAQTFHHRRLHYRRSQPHLAAPPSAAAASAECIDTEEVQTSGGMTVATGPASVPMAETAPGILIQEPSQAAAAAEAAAVVASSSRTLYRSKLTPHLPYGSSAARYPSQQRAPTHQGHAPHCAPREGYRRLEQRPMGRNFRQPEEVNSLEVDLQGSAGLDPGINELRHTKSQLPALQLVFLMTLLLAATGGLLAAGRRAHGLNPSTEEDVLLQLPQLQPATLPITNAVAMAERRALGEVATPKAYTTVALKNAAVAPLSGMTAAGDGGAGVRQENVRGVADEDGASQGLRLASAGNDDSATVKKRRGVYYSSVPQALSANYNTSLGNGSRQARSSGSNSSTVHGYSSSKDITSAAANSSSPLLSGAMLLQQCLNKRYENVVAGWEDVGTARATVKVIGTWWSTRKSTVPLTVVTQLSANRLQQLRAMCRAWHGPLSAVVYVPVQLGDPKVIAAATAAGDDGDDGGGGSSAAGSRRSSRRRNLGGSGTGKGDGKRKGNGKGKAKRKGGGRRRPLSEVSFNDHVVSGSNDYGIKHGGSSDGVGGDGGGASAFLANVTTRRQLRSVHRSAPKIGETGFGFLTAVAPPPPPPPPAPSGSEPMLGLAQLTLLRDTVDEVRAFWQEIEQKRWCALDVMLVYELYNEARALKTLYPVNMLRNWARLQARTPLIAMLDVDMLPSRDLLRDMRNKETARSGSAGSSSGGGSSGSGADSGGGGDWRPAVYVLPAFQTANETSTAENIRIADRMANLTKSQLEVAVVVEAALPFHVRNFPAGHGATDYLRWFKQANEAYDISYARKFEPWFMAGRQVVPWHDVRLRGYGHNKIIQVAATNATGAQFKVHPRAFLIHRPHSRSTARGELSGDTVEYRRLLRGVMRNVTGSLLQNLPKIETLLQEFQQLQHQGQQAPPKPPAGQQRRQRQVDAHNGASAGAGAGAGGSRSLQQQLRERAFRRNLLQMIVNGAQPTEASINEGASEVIRQPQHQPQQLEVKSPPRSPARPIANTNGTCVGGHIITKQLIARRHADSILQERFADKLRYNIFWSNLNVYRSARQAMRSEGGYVPVLDPGTQHCLDVLPWWAPGDGSGGVEV
ncbi:hypothetical protein VOLCADRAFT_96805 [Volvox carteri f. nagariensis]|uniref:Uncharacterized protein n=1 Tax=Volvox carteri f. nagariensis TaxID=3068 RepID=D8UB39_VOLCA|nr:uncharacterized protein VOLCADRAFT_96805 [Volvox carteri f. nagariensis]EFJ43106.1 hypothetical protein VOLCADRAFT_96805 [Volvox carteri f. nagariensis]|eukprot:XP_002955905.1 hypothetical protein VOLCADRAFT_96805 [Volvox carteri f. nagariensis]